MENNNWRLEAHTEAMSDRPRKASNGRWLIGLEFTSHVLLTLSLWMPGLEEMKTKPVQLAS